MPRDILSEIRAGMISADEAEAWLEQILDVPHANENGTIDIQGALCLSRAEWTAYAHGVPFTMLAEWRYVGWPTECFRCGRQIDPARFHWLAQKHDSQFRLRHVDCVSAVKM
jgi:hypothetical protein